MTARAAPHWAELGESTFVAGIWFLYGVHRVLGRRVLRLLLWPVALCWGLAQPTARHASLEYLGRMQAAHGVPAGRLGTRHWLRHLLSFAETILDKLLAFSGRYPWDSLRFEGLALVDALVARRQGALLVTAHMGCLELCQAMAGRVPELKLTVLVHTRHAERFNRLLRRLQPRNPVELLQVTEVDAATAVMLGERVAAGEFVAIVGDRVPVSASKITRARFLGHDAPFPVGAYVLASLMQCPLLLMGCVREAAGHVVHFELLSARVELPRAQREQRLIQLAALFAARVEALLVRAPYDWFNFFPFWAQGRSGAGAAPKVP
ncbi:acyltransferase [Ramlibacter sp.]|uniref:LpxL/LpxP family acyltransferase n=1 Tax=Ramlibacter sp. TaxID=1917967 RepID=UPI0017C07EFA|nr:acyltransferase [Ramlibacter sp.]MBA2673227.1 acyltransferase [Ramlibacter sp.]